MKKKYIAMKYIAPKIEDLSIIFNQIIVASELGGGGEADDPTDNEEE